MKLIITTLLFGALAQAQPGKLNLPDRSEPKEKSELEKSDAKIRPSQKATDSLLSEPTRKSPREKTSVSFGNEGGGGGNTLLGKPIENYVGDISQYSSYRKIIVPLLENLDHKIPNFSGEMRIALSKAWYFVPVKLDQLPTPITGIRFNSDQTIVQLQRSVWVDKTRFAALNEQDQGTLLLHELVMAAVMFQRRGVITAADSDIVRATTIYLRAHASESAETIRENLRPIDNYYPLTYDWLVRGGNPMPRLYNLLQSLKKDRKLPNEHQYYGTMHPLRETICVSKLDLDPINGALTVRTSYRNLDHSEQTVSEGAPTELTVSGFAAVSLAYPVWGLNGAHRANIIYEFLEGPKQGRDGEIRRALVVAKEDVGLRQFNIAFRVCHDSRGSGACTWAEASDEEIKAENFDPNEARTCDGTSFSRVNVN